MLSRPVASPYEPYRELRPVHTCGGFLVEVRFAGQNWPNPGSARRAQPAAETAVRDLAKCPVNRLTPDEAAAQDDLVVFGVEGLR